MRSFLFLILFCFSSFSLAGLNSSDPPVLDIDSVSQSIWRVRNVNFKRNGTGFFIGPNHFITNFHVIYSLLKDSKIEELVLSHDELPLLKVKKVLALSAPYDLALLEVKTEKAVPHLYLRKSLSGVNKNLVILGYPNGKWKQINKIGEFLPSTFKRTPEFFVDCCSLSGSSGSPALDNKGQVVGVSFEANANFISIINLPFLKRFISGKEGQSCKNSNVRECMRKTLDNLKKRAKQGDAIAQYEYGVYYHEEGEEDPWSAFRWLERSARQGYFRAQYKMTYAYIQRKKAVQNLNWLNKAIDRVSSYFVGEEQDWDQAFNRMKKNAEQDHPLAQYILGLMYTVGKDKNLDEASKWFEKSAQQGYIPAKEKLDYVLDKSVVGIEAEVSKEKVASTDWVSSHKSLSSNEDSCFKTIKSLYPDSLKL